MFLAYFVFTILKKGTVSDKAVLAGAFAVSCLIVGLSVYHSWVNEFQAQGRYLFAVFPILAVVLARSKDLLIPSVVNVFLLSCFFLSLYSFVGTGLGQVFEFRDLVEINPEFRRPE